MATNGNEWQRSLGTETTGIVQAPVNQLSHRVDLFFRGFNHPGITTHFYRLVANKNIGLVNALYDFGTDGPMPY
jgi:hypothetical protein